MLDNSRKPGTSGGLLMRYLAALVMGFTMLLLNACAFSAVKRPNPVQYAGSFKKTTTIEGTKASGMQLSKEVLGVMGYEVSNANDDLGLIRSKVVQVVVPETCDCGTWNMAPVGGSGDSVLQVTVQAVNDAEVNLTLEHSCGTNFKGQNLYGATTRQETYQCASRGVVERLFWATLAKIIEAKRTAGR
jgi:hypothetical protein